MPCNRRAFLAAALALGAAPAAAEVTFRNLPHWRGHQLDREVLSLLQRH